MRSIIVIFLTTILISGCVTERASVGGSESAAGAVEDGRFDDQATFDGSRAVLKTCSGRGGTHVNLFYGNSEIRTAGVAHLKAGKFFGIKLIPHNDANNRKGIDYKALNVTISGKSGGSPSSDWLTAGPASYNKAGPDNELVICVPKEQAEGDYYYNIVIDQTGSLDPRAKVNE